MIGNSCDGYTNNTPSSVTYLINDNPITSNGTLTSWCINMHSVSVNGSTGKLKIFRNDGTTITFISESDLETINSGLNTFTCNIPVIAGDYIGIYVSNANSFYSSSNFSGYSASYYKSGDVITTMPIHNNWYTSQSKISCGATIVDTPIATHYIEYNFSNLPSSFNDIISNNILVISDKISSLIDVSLSSGVTYIKSTFVDSKFRIYIFVPSTLYNLGIQTLDIWQTLRGIGELILGTIIFSIGILAYAGVVTIPLGTWIAAVGVGIAGVGIYDITTSLSESSTKKITPVDKVKIVKDFIDNYIMKNCNEAYPTCAITTPTCDTGSMRAYLSCVNNAYITGCQYAKTVEGLDPSQFCDPLKIKRTEIDTCLANNTCTPTEAKKNSNDNIVVPAITNITNVINTISCPGQTWDAISQKCVDLQSDCWIPFCLISNKTVKTIAYIGGGLVIGYIGYKLLVKK